MNSPKRRDGIVHCVAGVLVRGGEVLLVKRSPQVRHYPDVWDLFGGHVEAGESLDEALRREAREELQVEVISCQPLGTVYDPVEPAEITIFAVNTWIGEPVNAAPEEHSAISWFSAEQLPASEGLEPYRQLVVRALASNVKG